jgi:branched-chain amino acid aminotransferase
MRLALWKLSPDHEALSLVPIPKGIADLDGLSIHLPQGGYTTFRTYHRSKVLRLSDHFERLENTAAMAGAPVRLDRPALRAALRRVVDETPIRGELRLRLTLDLEQHIGTVYISVEKLTPPPKAAYRSGVPVVTTRLTRSQPRLKLTDFIAPASEMRHRLPGGVNEALLVNEQGEILEGTSSNFFAVKADQVWTANEGILEGITRSIVLESILNLGIPLRLQPVAVADLAYLQEAWITSASRAVLPVVRIDGVVLGDGKPGRLARLIMQAFAERLESYLESL